MFQFDQTYEDYLLSLGRENTDQRMTDAQFVVPGDSPLLAL